MTGRGMKNNITLRKQKNCHLLHSVEAQERQKKDISQAVSSKGRHSYLKSEGMEGPAFPTFNYYPYPGNDIMVIKKSQGEELNKKGEKKTKDLSNPATQRQSG